MTQPTRSVAVTAVWQIVVTPPAPSIGCPITVFKQACHVWLFLVKYF